MASIGCFSKSLKGLEQSVIKTVDNIPILITDMDTVSLGPALRRGVLDKVGSEVVGGMNRAD